MDILVELTSELLLKQGQIIEEWMQKNKVTEKNVNDFVLEIDSIMFPDAYLTLKRKDKVVDKLHIHYEIKIVD